jgi:DNA-binding MarR family transcriptional regulator
MERAVEIIKALIGIQERSDVFRHGREDVFQGIHLAEVHCIDWIGMIDDANVTKIAREMGLTRGAVSKISKKLLAKGWIEKYQRSGNNKEIYYRLTAEGQPVYNEHKKCHNQAIQEKLTLLTTYTDQEQVTILHFLADINGLLDSKLADEIHDAEE